MEDVQLYMSRRSALSKIGRTLLVITFAPCMAEVLSACGGQSGLRGSISGPFTINYSNGGGFSGVVGGSPLSGRTSSADRGLGQFTMAGNVGTTPFNLDVFVTSLTTYDSVSSVSGKLGPAAIKGTIAVSFNKGPKTVDSSLAGQALNITIKSTLLSNSGGSVEGSVR